MLYDNYKNDIKTVSSHDILCPLVLNWPLPFHASRWEMLNTSCRHLYQWNIIVWGMSSNQSCLERILQIWPQLTSEKHVSCLLISHTCRYSLRLPSVSGEVTCMGGVAYAFFRDKQMIIPAFHLNLSPGWLDFLSSSAFNPTLSKVPKLWGSLEASAKVKSKGTCKKNAPAGSNSRIV